MNSCMNCLEEKQIRDATTCLHSAYENMRCKGVLPDEAVANATKIVGEVFVLPISVWGRCKAVMPLVLGLGAVAYPFWWLAKVLMGGGE